jgi:uncharacterized membrane protein
MEFLYFLGRLHVLVLHIPIGLIVALCALEFLARREKYRHLEAASPFLWSAAAISAVVTVVMGYLHFSEGGFEGPSGYQHRTFGTILAALLVVVALLRTSKFANNYRPVFFPASILMLLLVSITGHFGGNLTHGSNFLVEYAPQFVRSMAGLGPRRPPVTSLAAADPFHDLVGPMFERRCSSCHNSDKQQAELDLTSYASVMRGGETGAVVSPGRPQFSELLSRISLPPDDEAFMPAEGKTPLTSEQVQIIEWWIGAGAPADQTFADLDTPPDPETEALIKTELGLGS